MPKTKLNLTRLPLQQHRFVVVVVFSLPAQTVSGKILRFDAHLSALSYDRAPTVLVAKKRLSLSPGIVYGMEVTCSAMVMKVTLWGTALLRVFGVDVAVAICRVIILTVHSTVTVARAITQTSQAIASIT